METPTIFIESLLAKSEAYGKTSIELAKLKSLETTTKVVASLVSRMAVIISFSLFLLILNVGVALWLGELLGKVYYGFFIVAGVYLLVGFVFHFFLHSWVKKPVSHLIIAQAINQP